MEELINNLEKNIDEWSSLNQLDLTPLVKTELECLSEQMKKLSRDVPRGGGNISGIEDSECPGSGTFRGNCNLSKALDAAKNQIKKAEEMIARANTILSKAEPLH